MKAADPKWDGGLFVVVHGLSAGDRSFIAVIHAALADRI
jgi:hypothetical protein